MATPWPGSYCNDIYPFRVLFSSFFGDPEHIHSTCYSRRVREGDQGLYAHDVFYRQLFPRLQPVYELFVREIFEPERRGYAFQGVPTLRIQLPDERGTKEFHRDRDYHHDPATINVLVPLTRMRQTTALWVEDDNGAMRPTSLEVGQYLVFDGANRMHGTLINEEGYTRASFDFRLLPKKLANSDRRTVSAGRSLKLGDYYRT